MDEEKLPPEPDYNKPQSEEDEAVAFCVDCCSTIPDKMAERDVFLQVGKAGICPFCKGPVIVAYASSVPALRKRREAGGFINVAY